MFLSPGWWQVVENKRDPVFLAAIHHAVIALIVDLIGLAGFKTIRATVDHKAHAFIG